MKSAEVPGWRVRCFLPNRREKGTAEMLLRDEKAEKTQAGFTGY
jgi:hypothetical protein